MRTVVVEVDEKTVVEVFQDPDTLLVATQVAPDVIEIEKVETVVTIEQPAPQIAEVVREPNTVLVVDQPAPHIVEVISRGPQGPPGDIPNGNATSILMYPVRLVDGEPDDLLSFTGAEWRNKAQEKVTDGGNF